MGCQDTPIPHPRQLVLSTSLSLKAVAHLEAHSGSWLPKQCPQRYQGPACSQARMGDDCLML